VTLTKEEADRIRALFDANGIMTSDAKRVFGTEFTWRIVTARTGSALPSPYVRGLPTNAALSDPDETRVPSRIPTGLPKWQEFERKGLGYHWATNNDFGDLVIVLVYPWGDV
jgi:hypothetical protein